MTERTNGTESELFVRDDGIEIQDPENPRRAWIKTDTNGEDLIHIRSDGEDTVL